MTRRTRPNEVKPRVGKRGPLPGGTGKRWDQDVSILRRLSVVSSMHNQGREPHEIAAALGYTLRSVYNDFQRIDELHRRRYVRDVELNTLRSISMYEEIMRKAWELSRDTSISAKERVAALREVREAQQQIDRLQGNEAPKKLAVQGALRTGDPREFSEQELADIVARAAQGAGTAAGSDSDAQERGERA